MSYVTAIPGTVPNRTDNQEDFSNLADALVASFPTFQTQINTVVDEINGSVDAVEADRVAVVALKADTQEIKDATDTVLANCQTVQGLTEDARDLAEDYRDSAQTAAAAAQSAAGLPTITGKAGYALAVNSTSNGVEWVQFIKPDSIVVLTSGTSWTCPAGVKMAHMRIVGGCGSGAAKSTYSGGGGGAGGEIEALITLVPGTAYAYSLGAGGLERTVPDANGLGGGSTTITIDGDTFTVTGGGGGWYTGGAGSPGGVNSCPYGLGKNGNPGQSRPYDGTSTAYGGVSTLGTKGGKSEPGNGYAGDDGKIILELYK